jgi:hypothetical protein
MPRLTFEIEELSFDNIQFMQEQFRSGNNRGFLNDPGVLVDLPKNFTNVNEKEELNNSPSEEGSLNHSESGQCSDSSSSSDCCAKDNRVSTNKTKIRP